MRSLLTALGLAIGFVMPARAQDGSVWAREVRLQLAQNAAAVQLLEGMTLSHDVFQGWLRQGYYSTHTAVLQAGTVYIVTAVCDRDCSDIDLRVFRNGTLVGSDTEEDDRPMVRVAPLVTRLYTIRATMAACSDSPCYYGIGIYARTP
jgi:hypothetical protein